MLNGLDLFSGIGGISLALNEWVRPVAYCENDRYAQGVLLSRMASGALRPAPIWDDVRTLRRDLLPRVDIITGGFPCQDISSAGSRKGLAGERSGLAFEMLRLCRELRPRFLFVENVSDFNVRGAERLLLEINDMGYDVRWTTLSAASIGARHLRRRFFALAADTRRLREQEGCPGAEIQKRRKESQARAGANGRRSWAPEPDVGRMVYGIPRGMDRIRALGNAVVPLQARTAFERLMEIEMEDVK